MILIKINVNVTLGTTIWSIRQMFYSFYITVSVIESIMVVGCCFSIHVHLCN